MWRTVGKGWDNVLLVCIARRLGWHIMAYRSDHRFDTEKSSHLDRRRKDLAFITRQNSFVHTL